MPKFKIGQELRCHRKNSNFDFDFVGKVIKMADTGNGWEYEVENSPYLFVGQCLLIWESEMEAI